MHFGYLASTARSEFWSRSDPVLLLGAWCRPGLERFKPSVYAELPCVWDKEGSVEEAETYCWSVFQNLVPELAKSLNRLHGASRSQRYWEVLLSFWLLHFTYVMYDRFLVAKLAVATSRRAATTILPREAFRIPPTTFDAIKSYSYDDWQNLQLFSDAFRFLGVAGFQTPDLRPEKRSWTEVGVDQRPRIRQRLGGLRTRLLAKTFKGADRLLQMGRGLISRNGDASLLYIGSRFKKSDLLLLSVFSNFALSLPHADGKPGLRLAPSFETRHFLSRELSDHASARDEFETLLIGSAAYFMPACLIEGYGYLASHAVARFGSRPRVLVFDAPAFSDDPFFQEYAARCAEAGKKLICIQHGGVYGHTLTSPAERMMVEVCDRFISFGWRHDRFPEKTIPLPSPYLYYLKRAPSRDSILYVSYFGKAYLHRLVTLPHGAQWDNYLQYCETFLKSLSHVKLNKVRFRPFFSYCGYQIPPLMESLMKGSQRESRLASKAFGECRLAVIDHAATAWIEALACNVPTILFWNPSHWQFRTSAEPFIESLANTGILYFDPEAAARKVEEIYDRAEEWWAGEEIQAARRSFCERYAWTTPGWRDHWVRALRELGRGA